MGHRSFSKSVFIQLRPAGTFQARSPLDAAQYLEQLWPGARNAHYRQAKVLCHAAVDGIVEPETARLALIDAAHRAGVLAEAGALDGVIDSTGYVAGYVDWVSPGSDDVEDLEVTDMDLVGYDRASDIVADPSISPSRKRALLAYWASDLHAVAGSPSLRCVGGVTNTIDSILDALCSLDAEIDQAAMARTSTTAGRPW